MTERRGPGRRTGRDHGACASPRYGLTLMVKAGVVFLMFR